VGSLFCQPVDTVPESGLMPVVTVAKNNPPSHWPDRRGGGDSCACALDAELEAVALSLSDKAAICLLFKFHEGGRCCRRRRRRRAEVVHQPTRAVLGGAVQQGLPAARAGGRHGGVGVRKCCRGCVGGMGGTRGPGAATATSRLGPAPSFRSLPQVERPAPLSRSRPTVTVYVSAASTQAGNGADKNTHPNIADE
jgi:hypothetical protein